MTNYPPGYVPQIWTIGYNDDTDDDAPGFWLLDPKGTTVYDSSEGHTPKELSRHAWTHGADEVRWVFDLNLDPDK